METSPRAASLDRTAMWLVLVVATLLGLGLIMVYSTRALEVTRDHGLSVSWRPFWEQLAKIGVGATFLLAGLLMRPARLLCWHRQLLVVALLLLAAVLIPGIGAEKHGARRWLMCGPFGFQPVELAKVALIVFVAARVEFLGQRFKTLLRGFLPVAVAMGVLMGLLYMQPDFGSMVFVVGLGSLLLILGGARLAHFAGLTVLAAPLCVWYVPRTLDHVTRRLAEFEVVPVGSQLWQSLLALKASGMSGSDLGAGAAKLGYLPMISNDFILAGIGDEMGFIGTSLVVMLFLLFTVLATRIVVAQRSPALFLMGAGVTISIAVQAVINIAVVTGAVPTKGIALPFISVGGSSMALSLFGVGLLIGMARDSGERGSRRMLGARLRDYLGGLVQTVRGRSDG